MSSCNSAIEIAIDALNNPVLERIRKQLKERINIAFVRNALYDRAIDDLTTALNNHQLDSELRSETENGELRALNAAKKILNSPAIELARQAVRNSSCENEETVLNSRALDLAYKAISSDALKVTQSALESIALDKAQEALNAEF